MCVELQKPRVVYWNFQCLSLFFLLAHIARNRYVENGKEKRKQRRNFNLFKSTGLGVNFYDYTVSKFTSLLNIYKPIGNLFLERNDFINLNLIFLTE